MWRPIEQYGVGRLFAAVALCAVAFMTFRYGFTAQSAEWAVPVIGAGCLAAALAVGVLTMTRPWRIVAMGLVLIATWAALIGMGAVLIYLLIYFLKGPSADNSAYP